MWRGAIGKIGGFCVLGATLGGCHGGPPEVHGHTGSSPDGGSEAGGAGAGDSEGVGGFVGSGGETGGYGQGGGEACAGVSMKAELVPLDMYVLLDKSGSMSDPTGPNASGPSKWAAVTTALAAFFGDPGSSGLGVGIQFFPVSVPNVPSTCSSSAECGAAAPCFLKACELAMLQGTVVPCDVSSDCPPVDTCVPLGVCSNDNGYVCLYEEPPKNCSNGLGVCTNITHSYCVNEDSCLATDYASPAVEIGALSGGAQALLGAIQGQSPGGATPTGPALKGAIEHAKSWAVSHPGREVVAVLATDGLPTACQPQNIASIASIAGQGASGDPGVSTFVIGVFAPGDMGAQANLDQIALSGGTEKAFFIKSNQDVTQGFIEALEAIRNKTLACDYQIPAASGEGEVDYGKVNVAHTPEGESGPHTVFYVGDASGCDPVDGGWYYDTAPGSAAVPTKIVMCPATCSELTVLKGQVDIQIGCQTVVPEPK